MFLLRGMPSCLLIVILHVKTIEKWWTLMCCLKILIDLNIFDHVSKDCMHKKTYKMRLYLVFYLPASKCKGKTLVFTEVTERQIRFSLKFTSHSKDYCFSVNYKTKLISASRRIIAWNKIFNARNGISFDVLMQRMLNTNYTVKSLETLWYWG